MKCKYYNFFNSTYDFIIIKTAVPNVTKHTAAPVREFAICLNSATLPPKRAINAVCSAKIDISAPAKLSAFEADRIGLLRRLDLIRFIIAVVRV